jgi:hypothetical protein
MTMVVISTFSLGTGSRADNFPCESFSFIGIFIASGIRDQIVRAAFFGLRDRMLIPSEDALRLKVS